MIEHPGEDGGERLGYDQPHTRIIIVEVTMTEYAVGWGGLALINAALANIDGRSPLKYFLGSLLFGPFVTIVLAATRRREGRLAQVDLWRGRA